MNGAAQVAQRSADGHEDARIHAYVRTLVIWQDIADAAKRADAVARLDAALRYGR